MKTRIFAFLLLLASSAFAADPVRGLPPFGSLQSAGFDTVNLQNLNVNFSIPIMSIPGRGRGFSFAIVNDSLLWKTAVVGTNTVWQPVSDPSGKALWGWMKDAPGGRITYTHTQTQFKCRVGSQWEWAFEDIWDNYQYIDPEGTTHPFWVSEDYDSCSGDTTATYTGYSADAAGYFIDIHNTGSPTLISPDGLKLPSETSTDSNGNLINKIVVNSSETDWKDTVGHTALKIITGGTSIQYQYQDSNGSYQTATLTLQNTNIKTNFACSGVQEYTGTASLPISLQLPNGKSYAFTYEPTPGYSGYYTGRVKRVTLPTGGYYEFQYPAANDSVNCADGTVTAVNRLVSDGTTTSTWLFARSSISGLAGTTTITAPKLSYDSVGNQAKVTFNASGLETSRLIYQGTAPTTLLRTINTTWAVNGTPATQTVVLENSFQAGNDTTYDNYGNLTQKVEYDWAQGARGAIKRKSVYTYLNTADYTSRNILNRLTSLSVKDGNDTVQYRQDIAYDESGYINTSCPTGVDQHDDINFNCSVVFRGNPTTITSYLDPATPGTGIVKHLYYDWFGNVVKQDGACCVQQTWAFSGTTQYAYPDSTTLGSGSPTLTTSTTYNPYTGLPALTTDANNQTTSYVYYSVMNRLQSVTRSDLAHIDYSYDDTLRTTTVKLPLDGTNPSTASQVQQVTSYDPLGRVVQQSSLDTSGAIVSIVDTQYDAVGRPYRTSNPRSSIGSDYFTETRFDGLGRPTLVIPPDGSATTNRTTYSYAGKAVTVTDPAGLTRRTSIDGLGRLSQVDEPGPTLNTPLTTTYQYNVLDKMTSVAQGVQTRSWTYDALGRAVTETNPENGQTCYGVWQSGACVNGYDNHSNLLKRTDARGVVTTYTYDGLDRLHQTDYTVVSGVPATISTVLDYGTSATDNNNGRLISMSDGTGSEAYTYNALGQVTQVSKLVGTAQSYDLKYEYTVGGSVKKITYPSGHVVDQSIDTAGRLSQIQFQSTNYASNFVYNPAGQVTGFDYGNAIHAGLGFNNRMQMSSLNYTNGGTTLFGLIYDYGYNVNNNGQIRKITDNVQAGRTATYTYDELGRLATAVTDGSTQYAKWGLSFTYDRYGNRTAQNLTAGTAPAPLTPVTASTNHLSGDTYDSGGNVTRDGTTDLQYDAENRLVNYGGGTATYGFDGHGLRVTRTYSSATTVYIFNGTQVIAEYALNAVPTSPTREYIYAGQLLAKVETSGTTYYYPDHLSARMTKAGSDQIQEEGHYPFGESWYGGTDKWRFTSYERDTESGNTNDYAVFRTYVNRYGRFLTPDPAGAAAVDPSNPQTWNGYAYVGNDPLGFIDPLGLCPAPGVYPNSKTCLYVQRIGNTLGCSVDGAPMDCGFALSMIAHGTAYPSSTTDGNCYQGAGGAVFCGNNPEVGKPFNVNAYFSSLFPVSISNIDLNNLTVPANNDSPTMAFIKTFFSLQPQMDAWNKGYYKCLAQKTAGGATAPVVTHTVGVAATKAAENNAATIAGAYYHFTDGRFTAWGKYSKVLVPNLAPKIAAAAEALDVAGWAYFDYELAKAIGECSEVLQ